MMRKGLPLLILLLFILSGKNRAQSVADNSLSCQAYYLANEEPGNPLLINFDDRSTGNIATWLWSFGDGTYSEQQNPSHLFPAPGLYTVCLTITNPDTADYCWDKYCDTIYINIIHDCEAKFSTVLDSLNDRPNTFLFTDISTGNPNSWLWIFGDGELSTDQNPVHCYSASGDYRVCLVIAETDSTGIQCYDSVCHDLNTPPYFDLGGHLFAGQYPINNPQSTGDTGVVFLYRIKGKSLVPIDTSRFTEYGYYAFPQRLNGDYLVRTELTKGSSGYKKFFPSYYPDGITWRNCGTISLTDSSSYHSDVHLMPLTDTLKGTGMISGMVVQNDTKLPVFTDAEVLLYDEKMVATTFTFSDGTGNFEIGSLPFGTYNLAVEVPGYYSRITTITLDALHPLADSVILELFNHDVTGFEEPQAETTFRAGNIYPDPVTDQLSLVLYSQVNRTVQAEVMSFTGQVQQVRSFRVEAGKSAISLPAGNLCPGFYLLLLRSTDGSALLSRKFIRN